jgi:hypothetical protein
MDQDNIAVMLPVKSNGKWLYTFVDVQTFMNVKDYNWHLGNRGYAMTHVRKEDGSRTQVGIHRMAMNLSFGDKVDVDHIDGNKLNNHRRNLRICDRSENLSNRGFQKNNTSGYKGVCFDKRANKWMSQIQHQGRKIHIGYYFTPEEAAHAYDAKARELHGEFGTYNFPLAGERSARDI